MDYLGLQYLLVGIGIALIILGLSFVLFINSSDQVKLVFAFGGILGSIMIRIAIAISHPILVLAVALVITVFGAITLLMYRRGWLPKISGENHEKKN